ncbi:MAG TPA: type II toxin-antitoxin system VapC family toxin [Polyangiaceae bacterium]|nr:type II toxin-antitoxin system VapC family toxin [Polyangiaceae bacterium]
MLVAIDTSVLVAWTVAKHPFHARATPWFDAIYRGEFDAMVCAHALAELYSVLTKIPEGLSPIAARLAVANVPNRIRVVPLTVGAYRAALDRCAERSLRSGSVFDALHLVAAERKGATALVTFNRDDFARLSEGDTVRVVVPPDPPSVDFTVLP